MRGRYSPRETASRLSRGSTGKIASAEDAAEKRLGFDHSAHRCLATLALLLVRYPE